VVICLKRGADLHMAQRMPLPLTVSRYSKIQIGFTFLVPAHPGSPGKRAIKWVCVCVYLQISQTGVRLTVAVFAGISKYYFSVYTNQKTVNQSLQT